MLITQVINLSYTASSYNSAIDYKIVVTGESAELENLNFSVVQNQAKEFLSNKESQRQEKERIAKEEAKRKALEEEKRLKEEQERKLEEEKQKQLAEQKAKEEAQKVAQQNQSQTNSNKPISNITGTKQDWMRAAGIPESDWTYVDYIVTRESTWNPAAVNKSSGACGLAQALPCAKTGCANYADPVCALRWQHSYVKARYGGYAGAYGFWTKNHWY
jgi:resuscitation-promoting factor RpfB